jgi:outer membrane receptor protein involved in Fe transport
MTRSGPVARPDGDIQINPDARIPLAPQHLLKAYADFQVTSKFAIDLSFNAVSSSYARGNENNQHKPDGVYYLGPGTSPGYGVINLGARYQIRRWIQVFGQINNLLDHHYYTAAQLGSTGFDANGNSRSTVPGERTSRLFMRLMHPAHRSMGRIRSGFEAHEARPG